MFQMLPAHSEYPRGRYHGGCSIPQTQTLLVLGLGFVAICLDIVIGVLFGKLNRLIGAAGISAYHMTAWMVQVKGRKYDDKNWLLMHAVGANTGGQINSVMAAAIMLSVLKGMGIG
jgi:Na+-transporting methylmalonyl-CoA/oxaloacetate decarboxylase beta subunit